MRAVQDENTRGVFLASYDVKHSIQTGGDKPARPVLAVLKSLCPK
jgi:hypothetical protein